MGIFEKFLKDFFGGIFLQDFFKSSISHLKIATKKSGTDPVWFSDKDIVDLPSKIELPIESTPGHI